VDVSTPLVGVVSVVDPKDPIRMTSGKLEMKWDLMHPRTVIPNLCVWMPSRQKRIAKPGRRLVKGVCLSSLLSRNVNPFLPVMKLRTWKKRNRFLHTAILQPLEAVLKDLEAHADKERDDPIILILQEQLG